MGEVNINETLSKIKSERIKERGDGLADLKHILSQKRRSSNIEVLSDKAYHKILEALFRLAASEKSAYQRTSKALAKNQGASRLTACAGVLRLAVEVGVSKFRYKTVKALVDHVIQTLPTSGGDYCEPLAINYIKSLRIVLEYQPHPEHFSKEEWCHVVDFCNEAMHHFNHSTDESESVFNGLRSASSSFNISIIPSATPNSVLGPGRKPAHHKLLATVRSPLKNSGEELVLCLQHLTSASNAHIEEKAQATLTVLFDLLQASSSIGPAQQAAFASVNAIMSRMITEDVSLAQETMRNAITLIRRFWQNKSTTIKEEMLITLLYGEVYLPKLIHSDETGELKAELHGLLEVLQTDYCKRTEREQLQIEDLDFSRPAFHNDKRPPPSTRSFELRFGVCSAEQPWAVLYISASIIVALDDSVSPHHRHAGLDETGDTRKRRRLVQPLAELLQNTRLSPDPERLYALHVLAFVLDLAVIDASIIQEILESLLPCLSDGNGSIASWAMLVIACAGAQIAAAQCHLRDLWLQVWRLTARNITSSVTCRAACQLMTVLLNTEIVKYVDVADLVDTMISSVDLNGPADCVDSSITMWSVLITLRGRENLSLVYGTSERIIRWLFNHWNPSRIQDRFHVSQIAHHCRADSILQLIAVCLGLQNHPSKSRYALNLGSIARARLRYLREEKLMKYLANDEDQASSPFRSHKILGCSEIALSETQSQTLNRMIIDALTAELAALLRGGLLINTTGASKLTSNSVNVISSLCIAGYAVLSHVETCNDRRSGNLRSTTDQLRGQLIGSLIREGENQDLILGVLESLGLFVEPTNKFTERNILADGVLGMAQGFNEDFWQKISMANQTDGIDREDVMDLDEDFESQESVGRAEGVSAAISHDEITAATDLMAFQYSLTAKLRFLSCSRRPQDGEDADGLVSSSFVDYLTSLPAQKFLTCRPFLQEVFRLDVSMSGKDACTLLQYLGEEMLQSYDLERSEVSLGVCLDIMTGLTEMWTNGDGGEILDIGGSLYEWFINTALSRGICSPHTHVCISSMLQRVIKVRPEFARSLSLPSPRTSLFRVLNEGSVSVKFHVGNNISEVFGLFVLKEHENILQDVIDNLPSEPNWSEGIALRLFILAHLAASWPTLLRRSVYAILETPAHVPGSVGYAKYCLTHVSESLGLKNVQDLFKLFVGQIIYTWLETQPLTSLPYTIFGYADLSELLRDVQDEVIGQVVMRGRDEEASQLARDLERPYDQLLELSFAKSAAYSIARDVAIPPTQRAQVPGAGIRPRKALGKERYASLILEHFPEILAVFYKTMDDENNIEKGFQIHAAYTEAHDSYRQIVSSSASTMVLPANQQPTFKAWHLIDEIEFLCRYTGFEARTMWTPPLYIYLLRELFDTIHTALGSLHACSVLRRIRILICMAGNTALENYPIEMALHSLRPFLTDTYCAEDAIGLVQYLLTHGASYLRQVPSFLAGMAVSTLASLKAFLNTPQESTTQESQFKATMSKANTFHGWFGLFLDGYESPQISGSSEKSFKAIIAAARNIRVSGNATKGTYESDLILELFEDQRSGRNLLNRPSQDLILGLLFADFEPPPDFRNDILGSEGQAAMFASTVWKICQRGEYGQNYVLWAGRVLGRAYAGSGMIDREMLLEAKLEPEAGATSSPTTIASPTSRSAILRNLCDILLVDDRAKVGITEKTLQSVITKAHNTEHFTECEQLLPTSLLETFLWRQRSFPASRSALLCTQKVKDCAAFDRERLPTEWVQDLCIALASTAVDDPIVSELPQILASVQGFAEQVFPYVLHLVLLREAERQQSTKKEISEAFQQWFKNCDEGTTSHVKIILRGILYLRNQTLPHESTKADRSRWLDLDYGEAASAATKCGMFKTALLFLEVSYSEVAKTTRRSSGIKVEQPTDILLCIFRNIDEPDSFYGVQQPSSLSSMMSRLEYEDAGFKSLSFRGAHYDSQIRQMRRANHADEESMIKVLDTLDLNGLSQSLLVKSANAGPKSIDSMMRNARKLEQWDISSPSLHVSEASTIFRAFQSVNTAADLETLRSGLNTGFSNTMRRLLTTNHTDFSICTALGALAILTEADEVLSSNGLDQLEETWTKLKSRNTWMRSGSFEHMTNIISCRETLFSSLSKSSTLQGLLKISQRDARSVESNALMASTEMSRHHGALQKALGTATYLNLLIKPCKEAGVDIEAAVQYESANVLWDQGEMAASIRMLQDLKHGIDPQSHVNSVGKPELLAKLGRQISEARLEKPDEIIKQYLAPAIKELHGVSEGDEAGQVFHEFASFCDRQLQNPDNLEDFQRIQKLRERKDAEVRGFEKMIRSSNSQTKEKDNLKSHLAKAKQWFNLDDREYQRLLDSRQAFLRQSLENYLLCLKACDKYDNDALRFSALWLEYSDSEIANTAVSKHIAQVGSRKFAPLMNQWSSRLLDDPSTFQVTLSSLVLRICVDHPFHGMYQVFAGSKTKGGKDETALARHAAAQNIVNLLKVHKHAAPTWIAIHNANINYVRFAAEKLDDSKIKPRSKVALRKSSFGQKIEQDVPGYKLPPPTMKIELRADCDYRHVPIIVRFQPEFTVASGISMPKIVTALASDGLKYKQLFKGGNDDLRQDSIMEQVFEQVSNLLQSQQATRQRSLGIRTYKVLPLTATSGIIEFVPNTIPLHDYLMPAHERHFPKDMKPNVCRKHIADAQPKSVDTRIKTFRQVTDHFHPVLGYFFTERFDSPDSWFDKRLAYTRSTAAISILGHVLGLGDRHGHNILLDEGTGEVVHIDLGIAFEQGRVLPVPEVVPFRLTRDLVDGMGITKTEGVFRRCCEFTLEALRTESYSIMTILDVLRYDPLYSWSLSPLRLKKMQDAQTEAAAAVEVKGEDPEGSLGGGGGGIGGGKRGDKEAGEAERALEVVEKKLGRGLSVTATVNELIQQATDERNLAVLFCGWAAYA